MMEIVPAPHSMDPPTFENLALRLDSTVAFVTLDRPERRNPLGTQTLAELIAAAAWMDAQEQVRTVVIHGAGKSFCAGADIASFSPDGADDDGLTTRERADMGRLMAEAIETMSAVTIAAMHGHCVGGGLVLASACDLRVAATDTYFAIPEIDLGIPLAWGGVPRLTRELGPALAKELILTCRPFTSAEAAAHGFINRVVEADRVLDVATALARLIGQKSAMTVSNTKRAVNSAAQELVSTGGAWADADAFVTASHDPESRAVASRYLEQLAARKDRKN